jgi:hypothetical protein
MKADRPRANLTRSLFETVLAREQSAAREDRLSGAAWATQRAGARKHLDSSSASLTARRRVPRCRSHTRSG